MNEVHRQMLELVSSAYDMLKEIPEESWLPDHFYDVASGKANMLAQWVIWETEVQLFEFRNYNRATWIIKSQPLWHAINELLGYVLTEEQCELDAFQIVAGLHPEFNQTSPKERGLAILQRILSLKDLPTLPLNKIGSSKPYMDRWSEAELDWYNKQAV